MASVVFLRGVNVGGHRTFRPAVLAKQLASLDVVNIGAAGTFVIRQPVTRARLHAELARKLPFQAQTMICRGRDILALMSHRHFAGQPARPDMVRFVSVLSRTPRSAPSPPVSLPASGKWLLKVLAREDRFVLGVYRRQMKAIGYLGEIDRLFGTPATTRSWNTIAAIAKVLERGADVPGRGDQRDEDQSRPAGPARKVTRVIPPPASKRLTQRGAVELRGPAYGRSPCRRPELGTTTVRRRRHRWSRRAEAGVV